MVYLLAGLALLVAGLMAMHGFTRIRPSVAARMLRLVGGFVALAAAVVFMVRGAIGAAIPLATVGVWLLSANQRRSSWGMGGPGTSDGANGRTSSVATATLDMELDLDSGAVRGTVKRGAFAGRDLDDLSPAEVAQIWDVCRFDDPQSAQILEAYLDRRHPSWREDLARSSGNEHRDDRATGSDSGSAWERRGTSGRGPMTVAEARRILGVGADATREEIVRAHKARMKQCHPDRGGSTEAAARVNEAKAVLLGR